ncbi:MAG: serine hydrolase domain-containing protein [Acidimicrobiia bacterium]|nr:serine hydrolase domain-containing protein [Acidimicrobiia bacterium]
MGATARATALVTVVIASCSSGAETAGSATPLAQASATPTTSISTTPPPTAPTLEDALGRTLEDWYGTGDIGGAVAAIGLADGSMHIATTGQAAPGEPAMPDDTMRIGSITKTYMAALTLRLADLGALGLDDSVSTHLPDLAIDDTITIRDLLAHTSGVTDPDPAELIVLFRADSGQRFEFDDLLAFANVPTAVEQQPAGFVYANAGYHVLGGVIEAASGTDVATALRKHVLDPAGLTRTHLAGAETTPAAIVPGNVDLDGDGREDSLAGIPYLAVETHAWTAGALVATAEDLIAFARSLFDGSIISADALDEMTDTSSDAHGHGLGIFDLGIDGRAAYGNSGGGPGFHANLAHAPTGEITAVVFTNCPSCPAGGQDSWQVLVDLLDLAEASASTTS